MYNLLNLSRHYSILFFCLFISLPAQAGLVTFEGFSDSSSLTNEIPGLTFSDATILTAGISLNEFDYPPYSGENVAAGLNGSIQVTFDNLMNDVSGYFTFAEVLTLSVFDSNGGLLANTQSSTGSNLGSNEFIALSATGIRSLLITSNSPFTLDDLSYVPEPSTFLLLVIGLTGIGVSRFTPILFKSH